MLYSILYGIQDVEFRDHFEIFKQISCVKIMNENRKYSQIVFNKLSGSSRYNTGLKKL